jgi:transcriptional regulator with XRE-family HTH domain
VSEDPSLLIAQRLNVLRTARGLSIRDLALASGLSVNTISLIERGKTSPTIATLHSLASALGVPMKELVEDRSERHVIFLRSDERPEAQSACARVESLGIGLAGQKMEPLLITLDGNHGRGTEPIVHLGHELVYLLEGCCVYVVDGVEYPLAPGDSLLFEAHLPHQVRAAPKSGARLLVVLEAAEGDRQAVSHHF